jgi:hypothetical protein
MIPLHRPLPALVLTLALVFVGCDSGGITVVPEVEATFGFEDGLGSWEGLTSSGGDGTAAVASSAAQASSGSSSVRLRLDDPSGSGAALITRAFALEPNQDYGIELSFDLGSSDGPGTTAWRVLAGATSARPGEAASVPARGDTGTDGASLFERRNVGLEGTTAADGELWISVGVGQATGGARDYFLDEVEVVLTRRDER